MTFSKSLKTYLFKTLNKRLLQNLSMRFSSVEPLDYKLETVLHHPFKEGAHLYNLMHFFWLQEMEAKNVGKLNLRSFAYHTSGFPAAILYDGRKIQAL